MNNQYSNFNDRMNQINNMRLQGTTDIRRVTNNGNIVTSNGSSGRNKLMSFREAIAEDMKKEMQKLNPSYGVDTIQKPKKLEWQKYQEQYFERVLDGVLEYEKNTNRIDEWILIKNFLVLFYKMVTGKDLFPDIKNIDYEHLLQKWLVIAGSYNRRVDVVNTKNEVIYSVPPLMFDSSLREKFAGDEIFNKSDEIQKINDWATGLGLGDRALGNYLEEKGEGSTSMSDEEKQKLTNEWLDIFKRYYLLNGQDIFNPDENKTEKEEVKVIQPAPQLDDDIDFF